MLIRLDKYLADTGHGTRSDVKSLIKSKSVSVNGNLCKDPGQKIDTEKDEVLVRGSRVQYSEFEYYMLHKPAGIITASSDKKEKTVVDLIESKKRRDLFPVGRLDRDTEGLLLITNDGQLSHRLLSPDKHVSKTYVAIVLGNPPDDITEVFESGVDIGDEKLTKPAKLKLFSSIENFQNSYKDGIIRDRFEKIKSDNSVDSIVGVNIFEITITEGRYHEIKRMFESVGCEVAYLKRYSMGGLQLDNNLKPGEHRELTSDEVNMLR